MPDIHVSEFTVDGVSWGQPISINWQPLDERGWATTTHLRAFQPQPEPEPAPDPSSALAGVEEVGDWIAARVTVDHHLGRIRLPNPVNSWSDVQNVCDGNAYVDRASVHFGRPCSEPHFGFWNAATDHAAELLGSIDRPAPGGGTGGDTSTWGPVAVAGSAAVGESLRGIVAGMLDMAHHFTCTEANIISRLYSDHGQELVARDFMQCHVQGDALECCEDHRAWYP